MQAAAASHRLALARYAAGNSWRESQPIVLLQTTCAACASAFAQRALGDDVFTRDYTSIGAACGIAAAFRAPIAGR